MKNMKYFYEKPSSYPATFKAITKSKLGLGITVIQKVIYIRENLSFQSIHSVSNAIKDYFCYSMSRDHASELYAQGLNIVSDKFTFRSICCRKYRVIDDLLNIMWTSLLWLVQFDGTNSVISSREL